MGRKLAVAGTVRVRAYDWIAEGVEQDIAIGWQRAHKHTKTPTPEQIRDEIYNAVTNGLCERLDFGD